MRELTESAVARRVAGGQADRLPVGLLGLA